MNDLEEVRVEFVDAVQALLDEQTRVLTAVIKQKFNEWNEVIREQLSATTK